MQVQCLLQKVSIFTSACRSLISDVLTTLPNPTTGYLLPFKIAKSTLTKRF